MKCIISSEFSEVLKASEALHQFIDKKKIDVAVAGQLELILVEAVNNVIEHAYKGKAGYPIQVEFNKAGNNVTLLISDQGEPPPLEVKQLQHAMPDEHDLPEGGWGLSLIQALTDKIEFSTQSNMNTLLLSKSI